MKHTFHELAFGNIEKRRPHAKRTGFWKTVYSQWMRESLRSIPESQWRKQPNYKSAHEEAQAFRPKFIPDLFEFYPDETWREIVLWEIEDTSKLTKSKMKLIHNWIGWLDHWSGWDVKLIITDRYGQNWTTVIDTRANTAERNLKLRADPSFREKLTAEDFEYEFSDTAIQQIRTWECDKIGQPTPP